MKWIFRIAFALQVLLLSVDASAQLGPPERVSVLTMGPGDHPFARFGHNAILLEWPRQHQALVYNFGTFAFDGVRGIQDFMAGRFRYWLSVSTLSRTMRFYSRQERSLTAQELALSAQEKRELADALELNALPEHRYYDYDYFYDNCSTRVRDAIDRVIGGAIARELKTQPGRLSFREHALRLTADAGWLYFGLDLALGPLTDKRTTRWEELFVPGELHDALAHVTRDVNGNKVPLVAADRALLHDNRPAVRSEPPSRVPFFGAIGLALGAVMAALARAGQRNQNARFAFGTLLALFGFVLGLLGTIFCVFWAFTKHWSAYRNENILVCAPWSLALLVLGFGVALGRPRAIGATYRVLAWSAAASLIALLLALIPRFGQDNTRIAALFAPLWLGAYFGTAQLARRPLWPFAAPTSSAGTALEEKG